MGWCVRAPPMLSYAPDKHGVSSHVLAASSCLEFSKSWVLCLDSTTPDAQFPSARMSPSFSSFLGLTLFCHLRTYLEAGKTRLMVYSYCKALMG
jgi:hypothetical protein